MFRFLKYLFKMATLEGLVNRKNWKKYKYVDPMVFVVEKFPLFLEAARDYNPRIMSHSNPIAGTVEEAVANDKHFGLHIELEYPHKGNRYIIDPDTKENGSLLVM